MHHTRLRLMSALLALACASPALRAADQPAPAAPPAPATAASALTPGDGQPVDPPVILPTITVSSARLHEIDVAIAKVDKQIAREKKKVKSSDLDRTLNNQKIATAAAIFGGNSSEHLSAIAASRVMLLESERGVLEAMRLPRTLKELKMLEEELEQLRTTRRNLDNINVPH